MTLCLSLVYIFLCAVKYKNVLVRFRLCIPLFSTAHPYRDGSSSTLVLSHWRWEGRGRYNNSLPFDCENNLQCMIVLLLWIFLAVYLRCSSLGGNHFSSSSLQEAERNVFNKHSSVTDITGCFLRLRGPIFPSQQWRIFSRKVKTRHIALSEIIL